MSHLSDDQLSARLDISGDADAAAAAAADRHLADCAECRERLAALSELDASLKGALTHDPGDAYFASFADRVTARIAATPAEAPAQAAAAPARGAVRTSGGGGFFGWLLSPRGLTLAGSMAGVAVVAALAYVLTRDGGADRFAQQVAPKSEVGATADAQPPAETQSAPATTEAPAPQSDEATPTPAPAARKEAATSATPAPVARTMPSARAREVRTDASGEPVAVQNRELPQGRSLSASAPTTSSSGPARVQKPQTVSPMGGTPAQRAPETVESAAPPAPPATRTVPQATTFAAPPTSTPTLTKPAAPPTPAPNPSPTKSRFDVSKLFEKAKAGASGTTSTPQAPQAQSQGFASPPAANDAAAPSVTAPVTPPMSQPSLEGAKGGNARRATESNFRASAYDMAAGRAREAEAIAARTHVATDWDRAAAAWRQAAQVAGEPGQERASRRAEAEARMTAWRTEPNELRRVAARSAVRGWIAVAEPGADQETAKKLEAELGR